MNATTVRNRGIGTSDGGAYTSSYATYRLGTVRCTCLNPRLDSILT